MTVPTACTSSFAEALKEMGCDKKTIERVMKMDLDGNKNGVLRVLATHRQQLLDTVHSYEKKISCLDYYVFHLKKEGVD